MTSPSKNPARPLLYLLALLFLTSVACRLGEVLNRDPLAVAGIDRQSTLLLSGSQPPTLDPALTRGDAGGQLGHIFGGLVRLSPDLEIEPDLAAGWEVSEDGLVYTFYLRPEARFHNGRFVTAHDVVFSWERATDTALGSDTAQTYLGDIEGVAEKLAGTADTVRGLRLIDDHTLAVRLTAPVVYFLAKLSYPVAFVVDAENVAQPDWQYEPNGTGPFRLLEWRDDDQLLLARNDHYHLGPAQVEHVIYNLGPHLPLALYEQDQLDLIGVGGATLERARDPNSPFFDELRTGLSLCTSMLALNNALPPFDDVRLRQAFNYALNKEQIVDLFLQGNGLVARGALPPTMPGYSLSGVAGYPYDPERARQLLAEAGYADPAEFPTVTFYTAGYNDVNPYVTAVITMWQTELGITIEPVLLEPFSYFDELYAGNKGHIFSAGWCADYPDPQNFLDILYHSQSGQNLSEYRDTAVDRLLEQARVEQDTATRLALYAEAERQIVAAAPVVFVSHSATAVLVKPYVENYRLVPIGVPQWDRIRLQNPRGLR
jgi:oligopeptide transport system substrate-binding protein